MERAGAGIWAEAEKGSGIRAGAGVPALAPISLPALAPVPPPATAPTSASTPAPVRALALARGFCPCPGSCPAPSQHRSNQCSTVQSSPIPAQSSSAMSPAKAQLLFHGHAPAQPCSGPANPSPAPAKPRSQWRRQGLMVGEAHLIGEANIFNVK